MKRKIITLTIALIVLFGIIAIPAQAATQTEINDAIQDGLAWLASHQNTDGSFYGSYRLADTAAAVLAFENEGHFPGGGTAYSDEVEKGLDFIFTRAYKVSINNQTYGYSGRNDNPDTNGNGQGVYFSYNSQTYETGMVMQAIADSNTPNRVVTTGNCAGMTYKDVLTDVVDWVAWGQIDGGSGRGGWTYGAYSNGSGTGDNSVSQWPVLGMLAAKQWGINAPEFVKSELVYWVNYIQGTSGGSGYNYPNDSITNVSKTGGLLVEQYYVGWDKNNPKVQAAINYINTNWNTGPSGTWYGNKGHTYAMFAVFKGLELMEVSTIPNAPASPETPAGDWWGDYCEYLVGAQAADGHWAGYGHWTWSMATGWYIIILQATVFPVTVSIDVPDYACDVNGYDVNVTYSVERFQADGTVDIYKDGSLVDTITLTAFQGTDTYVLSVPSDIPGTYTWEARLVVHTTGGISAQASDIDSVNVCETPQVSGIPDQTTPFTPFDLDDYLTYSGGLPVSWSASGFPSDWMITIDGDNMASVTAPEGATAPETITFTASVSPGSGHICSGSDSAVFTPNQPPVANAGPDNDDVEQTSLAGADVTLDGSGSSDPDGDQLTYAWTWDGGSAIGVNPTISLQLGGPYIIILVVNDGTVDSEPDTASITVVDTTAPTITAPADVTNVEQTSADGTPVELGSPTVSDICDASPTVTNDAPAVFPLGETVVTWTATDASGNSATATQTVTVVDTTAPELSVTPSTATLWPPNHKYVTVTLEIEASDICDIDVANKVELVSVTSDEPEDVAGKNNKQDGGDGNTLEDIVIVDKSTVKLRAERLGGSDGRVYTLNYSVTDDSGNTTTASVIVTVEHNPGEPAVDSGVQYTVTP